MDLKLGQDLVGSAYLFPTSHKLGWLEAGGWNHWKDWHLVLVVGWDVSRGYWPKHLHVASLCGLSFLTTWWLDSNGEYS